VVSQIRCSAEAAHAITHHAGGIDLSPQWILAIASVLAAVGTVGTLWFTVRSVAEDRRARRSDADKALARLVDCWATGGEWRTRDESGWGQFAFDLHVTNKSVLTVRQMSVRVDGYREGLGHFFIPVIPPGEEVVQQVVLDRMGGGAGYGRMIVLGLRLHMKFVDGSGRLWQRTWNGELSEVQAEPGWPYGWTN
jgi:hypothetical protein